MTTEQDQGLLDLTADIVSAFVGNNSVRAAELPEIISAIHASLTNIGKPKEETVPAPAPVPAVPIKKSVTDDYIVCLEDGKKFKSLKRHLRTHYDLSPEEYRIKWGLSADYPMVAPAYARERSVLARAAGLGTSRTSATAPVKAPEPEFEPEPANDSAPVPKRAAAKSAKPAVDVAPASAPAAEAAPRRRSRAKSA